MTCPPRRCHPPTDLGLPHQETPFDAAPAIVVVLDEALREAREDLAEPDRPGGEPTGVPGPDHQELLAPSKVPRTGRHREARDTGRRDAGAGQDHRA
ncbi:hypothetical protein ACFWVS_30605, partial [Streptomyces sp. NPDC058661]